MSCPDKKSQQDQLSWCTKPGHHAAGGGAQGLPSTCNTSNTTGTTATSVTNLLHQFLHRMQAGLALAFSPPDRPGHQLSTDWRDPHSGQDGISGVTYRFLSPLVFCQHRYELRSSVPRISQTRGVYYHFCGICTCWQWSMAPLWARPGLRCRTPLVLQRTCPRAEPPTRTGSVSGKRCFRKGKTLPSSKEEGMENSPPAPRSGRGSSSGLEEPRGAGGCSLKHWVPRRARTSKLNHTPTGYTDFSVLPLWYVKHL